jgi:hypothetical protein
MSCNTSGRIGLFYDVSGVLIPLKFPSFPFFDKFRRPQHTWIRAMSDKFCGALPSKISQGLCLGLQPLFLMFFTERGLRRRWRI